MKTKVIFGMDLDGVRWSEERADVGTIVCGPRTMVKFIEGRLGLSGREFSNAERLSAYRDKISLALAGGKASWCRRSFEIDPWSVSRQLLEWRDYLVGICELKRIERGHGGRLDALLDIEDSGTSLPRGFADRVCRIRANRRRIAETVCVNDDIATLPIVWREILEGCFERVDTGMSQMREAKPNVTTVRAHDEVTLARDFARFLSAGENRDVRIIAEGDTTLLDGELRRMGLPAIGRSAGTTDRAALQKLPEKVFEAWAEEGDGNLVSSSALVSAAERAEAALEPSIGTEREIQYAQGQIRMFRRFVEGQDSFRRSELLRLLEAVTGTGTPRHDARCEVGCAEVVESPGAAVRDKKITLWWDFTRKDIPPVMMLSTREAQAVDAACGGRLFEQLSGERNRRIQGWKRAFSRTTDEIVLFAPYNRDGESAAIHPYYDYLVAECGKEVVKKRIFESSALVADDNWTLAGRHVSLVNTLSPAVSFESECRVEPDSRLTPETLSQSQIETMLSCPFKWYQQRVLGRVPSPAAREQRLSTCMGNQAHHVIERLVKVGALTPADVDRLYDEIFERHQKDEIPELLLPENALDLEKFRLQLKESVLALWRDISSQGLKIVGSEIETEVLDFHGSQLHGRVDMLLEGPGGPVIYDFKWTSSAKRYENKVSEGKSVQFAVYNRLFGGRAKCRYYILPAMTFVDDVQDDADVFAKVEASYLARLKAIREGRIDKAIQIGLGKDKLTKEEAAERAAAVEEAGLSLDIQAYCKSCEYAELCGKERKTEKFSR